MPVLNGRFRSARQFWLLACHAVAEWMGACAHLGSCCDCLEPYIKSLGMGDHASLSTAAHSQCANVLKSRTGLGSQCM
jgi:hypothetical protein